MLVRVLVSALLLGAVLMFVDAGDVLRAVRDGDWRWFGAGAAVMGAAAVVGAIRWWILLEGAGIDLPASASLRPFAGSLLLNNVLPTSVGGDAVRVWVVGRERGRLVGAAAATIVDKVSAIVCLFVVAWAALAVDAGSVPRELVVALAWVSAGLVGALAVMSLAARGVRPMLHRLPVRVAGMLRDVAAMVRAWRSPTQVAGVLALGLVYQVGAVLALALVGKAVGIDLPFALAAVAAAIVVVAMLIPVSVGGLGLREGGFVLLLGQSGVSGADATAVSLLSAAVIIVGSAAVVAASGGASFLRRRSPRTRPVAREGPA